MFKSVLATEISSFLDMRFHTMSKKTYEYDVYTMTFVDKYLFENCQSKILTEDIINSLICSFYGSSKTVMNKVAIIRSCETS